MRKYIPHCPYKTCQNNHRKNLKGRCKLGLTYRYGQGICEQYAPKERLSVVRMPAWYREKKEVLKKLKEENYALQSRINELEDYISQGCCSQIEANERISEEQQRWLNLLYILKDIYAVIQKSQGISGWYLNGNIATWDEFEFTSLIEQELEAPGETQSKVNTKI